MHKYFLPVARLLSSPHRHYLSLLLLLAVLGMGHSASAAVTLSDFKIDGSTTAKLYMTNSNSRKCIFTLKFTQGNNEGGYPNSVRIYKTDWANHSDEEITGTSISKVSDWTYSGSSRSCIVTGEVTVSTFTFLYGDGHKALKAVLPASGSIARAESGKVTFSMVYNPSNPPAITLTNFTIDNRTSININSSSKLVTCRITLSKDPGYTDEFEVRIRGNNSGPIIASPSTNSYNWTWNTAGTLREYSFTHSFYISTADVPPATTGLVVHAVSPNNYLLGASTNTVFLVRVADPIPCISDAYLQNVNSFSGTKSSGLLCTSAGPSPRLWLMATSLYGPVPQLP
ncbi:hypothetical protein [Hymenobacter cellulosilyticus]|uniref:Uncharacterized protein n=1 Tax=Hymenobacter cellulosilyticus TaxID=2932248 RepID=A0A8T9Q0Q2_9BACT|nr:hypothetical protein [Hymenobacter cellulosilyticus]UOQ70957.1 hypothetical protein MUN79_20100 [Hymenobacter cellulosilyticus]